uniref:Synaptogyrin 3 n=1 Tax=Myotis myotis TaxID=51298 RepID=A0A7J7Y2Y3_MYOMY|nr:synaptogyrin 3 [Myotis myotis]
MEGASFGAGLAGAAVDPVSFAKRPQTLLRVVSWPSWGQSADVELNPRGVRHRRLRAHRQRGLRELRRRPGAALRLQRERRRLSLRRHARPRRLPRLRRLPAARPALPADQQRPRPAPRGAAGPGLLRGLVLLVVRGLLLPHQPVAAHGARAGHHAGGRRSAGRHRLQLLLHPQLGGAHPEGPAPVPPGHRHVDLCHRTAGHRGGPGLPWLPSGQRCGGHRDLPEPALHRDPGHQPQRVPGARLLVAGKPRPGLEGCPTDARPKASWDLPQVLLAQLQGWRGGHCGPSGAKRG